MNCIITSPEKTNTYKDIISITLPSFFGQTQILNNHAESFLSLQNGSIHLKGKKEQTTLQINSGECYIKDNIVTIIL